MYNVYMCLRSFGITLEQKKRKKRRNEMIWLWLLLAGHNLVNKSHSCSHKHTDTAIWSHTGRNIAIWPHSGRPNGPLISFRPAYTHLHFSFYTSACNLVGATNYGGHYLRVAIYSGGAFPHFHFSTIPHFHISNK